jgi:hypothetical protein
VSLEGFPNKIGFEYPHMGRSCPIGFVKINGASPKRAFIPIAPVFKVNAKTR